MTAKLIKPYLKAHRGLSNLKTSHPPAAPSNSTASDKGTFCLMGWKPLVNVKLIKPYLMACRRLSKSKNSPPPAEPSNSAASSPEVEACQESAYEPAPDSQFDSVGEQWQATWADSLQYKIWKNLKKERSNRMGYEHEPGVIAQFIGDGNCFFRALSYILTVAQREHQCLRALLCQLMHENNEQFECHCQPEGLCHHQQSVLA